MNVYDKNVEFFKKRNKGIYNTITQEIPLYDVHLEKVENQYNYIVEYNNARCFTHSIYDIDREMRRMVGEADENTETIILFGMGCGYAFEYIANRFKKLKRLLIIEPNLKLFRVCLEHIDIEEIIGFCAETVFIINRSEEQAVVILGEVIGQSIKEPFEVIYHLSYRSLFKGYYEKVVQDLISGVKNLLVNIETKYAFSRLWLVNALKNLLQGGVPLEDIIKKFQALPAIIVSAGPSLDKNIHLLHKAKEYALLVAVGSAIKILDSNGIVPDLRIAFDGGPAEKLVFDDINTSNTPLVYNDMIYHEILPEYEGHRIKFITDMDFINQHIYKLQGRECLIFKSGFTIAITALDILCRAGCSKVIFVGQDFCYTDGKRYAEGSWFKEYMADDIKEELFEVMDVEGKRVLTKKSFLAMKSIFQDTIKAYPDIKFINATEGGLDIRYAERKNLEKIFAEDLTVSNKIEAARQWIGSYCDDVDYSEIIDANMDSANVIYKDVQQILSINAERLEKADTLSKKLIALSDINQLDNELRNLDDFDKQLCRYNLYNEIVSNILDGIFTAISIKNQYQGADRVKRIEAQCSKLLSQAYEVNNYFSLMKEAIDEINEEYDRNRIKVLTFSVSFSDVE